MDAQSEYSFVRRCLGRYLKAYPEHADDLIQQAMLKLWEHRERLADRPISHRGRYVKTFAIDYLRKIGVLHRAGHYPYRFFCTYEDDRRRSWPEDTPYDYAAYVECRRNIIRRFSKYGNGEAIMFMREKLNMTAAEIGPYVGMTEAGVCWRLRKARQ